MQEKIRREMLKAFEAELKELVRNLLESLMQEERAMYLETHPTKANGYYTRDLLTLAGPLENLKVPRVRQGDFHPQILPYRRRASLELPKAILSLPLPWPLPRGEGNISGAVRTSVVPHRIALPS